MVMEDTAALVPFWTGEETTENPAFTYHLRLSATSTAAKVLVN
jgi:hypothetical protein